MAKFILLVESECKDPDREEEFNNWYNKIHFHDILQTKGFIKATRYVLSKPDERRRKYMALYEIETEDIDAFMSTHRANMSQKRQQGRYTELINSIPGALYQQIFSAP